MNNMVLFETGAAIAEALAIGRQSGVAPEVLLDALSRGSADSFALRNHGKNAMLPRTYPERAFSTRYAQKDLDYALALAAQAGVDAAGRAPRARALCPRDRSGRRRPLLARDRRARRSGGRQMNVRGGCWRDLATSCATPWPGARRERSLAERRG